jgi:hypothetical protein
MGLYEISVAILLEFGSMSGFYFKRKYLHYLQITFFTIKYAFFIIIIFISFFNDHRNAGGYS